MVETNVEVRVNSLVLRGPEVQAKRVDEQRILTLAIRLCSALVLKNPMFSFRGGSTT